MFTQNEARQRCYINRMTFHRRDGEYRVAPQELHGDDQERAAYYTDDLEDAVLTAGMMRRNLNKAA